MSTFKRISAIVLAMAMLFALFAGCGTTASNQETASAPTSEAAAPESTAESAAESAAEPAAEPAEEAPPAEEPAEAAASVAYPLEEEVHISALGPIYSPRAADVVETWQETPYYQAASEATNIYLDYKCVPTEAYNDQFNIVLASGDLPDMFFQGLRQYAGSADQGVDDGLFVNIAEYTDYCPDYMAALEAYGYENNVKTDSGYMVSFYSVAKNDPTPMTGFVIRQDLLDKLNLSAPETYEEYEAVLRAFKDEGVDEPLTMGYMGACVGDWLCAGFGLSLYSHQIMEYANKGFYQVDNTVHYGFAEESFKDYVKLMNKWYNEGFFSNDFFTENENFTNPDYLAKISGGQTGISLIDSSYVDTLEEEGIVTLAPIQDAVQNSGDVTHFSSCKDKEMDATYIISADCENIEAAIMWNNYWFTEEGSMLCNWGVEGETYVIGADGNPEFTDLLLNNPDGLTLSQATYIFIGKLGVYDNARDQAMYSDKVKSLPVTWATNKDNAYKIPQGTTMTADESSAYNTTFSDINTYVNECLVKFITGDKPLSELDGFAAELEGLGLNDCIGYWQAALDRFNER